MRTRLWRLCCVTSLRIQGRLPDGETVEHRQRAAPPERLLFGAGGGDAGLSHGDECNVTDPRPSGVGDAGLSHGDECNVTDPRPSGVGDAGLSHGDECNVTTRARAGGVTPGCLMVTSATSQTRARALTQF